MSDENSSQTRMNDYYCIDYQIEEGDDTLFGIRLLPDFDLYRGHFPGMPVAPGVCSMQMIKECAETLAGKRLRLTYIERCRFLSVMTPQATPSLTLRMRLLHLAAETAEYRAEATLYGATTTYMQFKGEFTANP
jgi:3-hydroxyacyl-[acyl-carrier-protein] dehydratase